MQRVELEGFNTALTAYHTALLTKNVELVKLFLSNCPKQVGQRTPFYIAALPTGALAYYISDGLLTHCGLTSLDKELELKLVKLEERPDEKTAARKQLERAKQLEEQEKEKAYESALDALQRAMSGDIDL